MLNLKIALRFLFYKPIKTSFALLTVLIGTLSFYVILNVGDGLKKYVLYNSSETTAHISAYGFFNEDPLFLNHLLDLHPKITEVRYVSFIEGEILLTNKQAITIKGLNFIDGINIQDLNNRILKSSFNSLPKPVENNEDYIGEVVVYRTLYRSLNLDSEEDLINKIIRISINNSIYKFKIVGFGDPMSSVFNRTIFTHIDTIKAITGNNFVINSIEINVDNPTRSTDLLEIISPEIYEIYPDARIFEWKDNNSLILNLLYIEDVTIFIIQVFTALAVSFGTSSILGFNMKEKYNQIGILKTMGLSNNDSSKIFFIQTFIISLIGVLGGLLLADFTSRIIMRTFTNIDGTPFIILHRGLNNYVTYITTGVILTGSIITSISPIKRIKKLKIIEVIKHE